MMSCPHLGDLPAANPEPSDPSGCAECRAAGLRWVHLRICLTCGNIACCDSSPGRHAAKHAAASDHPIIRSFEPGEDWRWCFVDETLV
jgi:CPA1 family monovalent cation:H+ antiporter